MRGNLSAQQIFYELRICYLNGLVPPVTHRLVASSMLFQGQHITSWHGLTRFRMLALRMLSGAPARFLAFLRALGFPRSSEMGACQSEPFRLDLVDYPLSFMYLLRRVMARGHRSVERLFRYESTVYFSF